MFGLSMGFLAKRDTKRILEVLKKKIKGHDGYYYKKVVHLKVIIWNRSTIPQESIVPHLYSSICLKYVPLTGEK